MTQLYADATVLIALGRVGRLDLLTVVEAPISILPAIQAEVTTQPAAANLQTFLKRDRVTTDPPVALDNDQAMEILGDDTVTGDVRLIAAVRAHAAADESVAVVSDDRRVRTVADGLGAQVTGTIGVLVRAVEAGLPADDARQLVRTLDSNGLHMTAQLRARALELIEDAATD
ncbi:MAG: DUF3368 domain-containing protein [Woeseiaceae bacterium]|nr:DUF3368 domain-containing protein [Woeseiaceae bacterium]